jgi:hypothetical protein
MQPVSQLVSDPWDEQPHLHIIARPRSVCSKHYRYVVYVTLSVQAPKTALQ